MRGWLTGLRISDDGTITRGSVAAHLCPQELQAFRMLVDRRGDRVSPDELIGATRFKNARKRGRAVLQVIYSLRRKVTPMGLRINNARSRGWHLEDASRERFHRSVSNPRGNESDHRISPEDAWLPGVTVDEADGIVSRNGIEAWLTWTEWRLFSLLYDWRGRSLSHDRAMGLLYWNDPDPPQDRALDAHVSKLRVKLRPLNIRIVCRVGFGWHLEDGQNP